MQSNSSQLVKMANQIATFFAAQAQNDPTAAASSVASHLKLFWAPSMRRQLIEAEASGHAEGLDATARAALHEHRANLLGELPQDEVAVDETFPEGGGDAG